MGVWGKPLPGGVEANWGGSVAVGDAVGRLGIESESLGAFNMHDATFVDRDLDHAKADPVYLGLDEVEPLIWRGRVSGVGGGVDAGMSHGVTSNCPFDAEQIISILQ